MKAITNKIVQMIVLVSMVNNTHAAQQKTVKSVGLPLATPASSVREYRLTAAGVLPITYNKQLNEKTVVLGRQTKRDKNHLKYDYFAGAAEETDHGNSVLTAAREWWEEARLEKILGWDINTTEECIIKNTKGYIILATDNLDDTTKNTYGVMYLVEIAQDIQDKLCNDWKLSYEYYLPKQREYRRQRDLNVSSALNPSYSAFIEKDKLVAVKWDDLLKWVKPRHGEMKKLRPVSKEVLTDNDNIQLRDVLSLVLGGATENNRYKEAKSDLVLGVFIFSTQKKENQYSKSQNPLNLEEKKILNEKIMFHLSSTQNLVKKAAIMQAAQNKKEDQAIAVQPKEPDEIPAPDNALPQATQLEEATNNISVVSPSVVENNLVERRVPQQINDNNPSEEKTSFLYNMGNAIVGAISSAFGFVTGLVKMALNIIGMP